MSVLYRNGNILPPLSAGIKILVEKTCKRNIKITKIDKILKKIIENKRSVGVSSDMFLSRELSRMLGNNF